MPTPIAVADSLSQTTLSAGSPGPGSDETGEASDAVTSPPPTPSPAHIKTLAGYDEAGDEDGEGEDAGFDRPGHVVWGGGETLFLLDTGNHRIRRMDLDTDEVTTLAGGEQGNATGSSFDAQFDSPGGIAVGDGVMYVADTGNHVIRKIDLTLSEDDPAFVTTLAGDGEAGYLDGDALDAQFNEPRGLSLDEDANVLYVADSLNHNIRQIDLDTMTVSTLAGDSPASDAVEVDLEAGYQDDVASAARFDTPHDVALSRAAEYLYVADYGNKRIRKIELATGNVTTLAGDGVDGFLDGKGTDAQFRGPVALAVDADESVWVADRENHRIRKITFRGFVSSVVGTGAAADTDGLVSEARIQSPSGVYVSTHVYVTTKTKLRLLQFP